MNRIPFLVTAVGAVLAIAMPEAPAVAAELDEVSVKLFNLQKAATARNPSPRAQYSLAQMYEYGLGTEENLVKARELYERAASKGLSVARLQLKELDRAEQEDKLERLQAEKAKADPKAQDSIAKVGNALESEAAQAARRAEREKARAERRRMARELMRKAAAAAKAGDPFGEE